MVSLSQCGVYATVLVEQGGLTIIRPEQSSQLCPPLGTIQPLGRRTDGTHVVLESHTRPILMDVAIQAVCGCSLGWVDGPNGRQQESSPFGRDHLRLLKWCPGRGEQVTTAGHLEL